MRVLVTGHNGYIGCALIPILTRAGHEVVGLDSCLFEHCTLGPDVPSIETIRKDVREVERQDVEGFDAVMHLAGISNDPLGDLNPECTYDINYRASVRLAKLAKEAGVERYLFSSSCSNYGAAGAESILTEEAAFNPVTPYGESKVLVERDVAQLADKKFTPVFLRNATAYGFSARLRGDLVLNNLVGWAYITGMVRLKSDGTPWRPIVHIEDISQAFLALLEAPKDLVHNQAFNVGRTEENYQMRDLAKIVMETVPGSTVTFAEDAGPDKRCYRVNCDKIHNAIPAFKPRWTARDGARQLYEAYKNFGLTLSDFEGARYMRIKHVRKLQLEGKLDSNLRSIPAMVQASVQREVVNESRTTCRICHSAGIQPVLSLGTTPLADALRRKEQLSQTEPIFPLNVAFCPNCSLVQLLETVPPEVLFCQEYPYYSSFTPSLLQHSRTNAVELIERRQLNANSLVIELASNDGYLLKNFVEHGIPVLGIDPAEGPARAAVKAGVPTLCDFFGESLARKLAESGKAADVIIANNVLAHVADLHGFVEGIRTVLKEDGVAAIEMSYVKDIVDSCLFDTIYHEHLCYFSVTALDHLFRMHSLYLNDVRRLPTQGGSLRIYVEKKEHVSSTVRNMLLTEAAEKVNKIYYYTDFADKVRGIRGELRRLLQDLKQQGSRIAAYGAAAKGSTMINYCDIDNTVVEFVVDKNTHKQGLYMPGQQIPVLAPEALLERRPDYVLLLAWNLADEILQQQKAYGQGGGRFIVPVPNPRIV